MLDDVKKFRERYRWTQAELAQRLDVSVRTIKRWESGDIETPKAILLALRTIERDDGLKFCA